jgi:hypothetical protein
MNAGAAAPPVRWTAADPFFEFSLLGLLTSGYLAVAGSGYLDAPTAVLTALGLLTRAMLALGWLRFELSPKAVNILTLVYIAFYPLDYVFVSRDFLTATVHLVFFLAIVKILTAVTPRDYFWVKVIAFLELLAASILSSSANYFLFLALFLFFGAATLTASEIRTSANRATNIVRAGQRRFGWRLAGLTVFTVAGILVLTGSLFFLLPRTARAAFQRFIPQRYHLPGFSNEVSLGQIGELKMRDTAVMHVRFLRGESLTGLKWRGAALSRFDGKRWFNPTPQGEVLRPEGGILRLVSVEDTLRAGRRIDYEVVMQEPVADALFFAGTPEIVHIPASMIVRSPSANTFRLGFGSMDRLRYTVYAVLEVNGDPRYRGELLTDPERSAHLGLPALDPRVGQLAARLVSDLPDDDAKARSIEEYLRRTFPYTTELPSVESPDPVADFLFVRRKGHCEYFASAMAVLLRSAGIPSRVTTGFQSGVYNPISGWWLIRARDAHSWVEAWIPGKGWTTFDPTPPDPNPPSASIFAKMHLYYDAMQVFWQDWVLAYDIERQLSLVADAEQSGRSLHLRWLEGFAERWSVRLRSWADTGRQHAAPLVASIALSAFLLFAGPGFVRWWLAKIRLLRLRRGEASASDATILYRRMLSLLRRKGIEKTAWSTPGEFVETLPDARAAALVREFTSVYNDLRFGNRQSAAPRLVELLEQLENTPISKVRTNGRRAAKAAPSAAVVK